MSRTSIKRASFVTIGLLISPISWNGFLRADEKPRVRIGFSRSLFRGLDERTAVAQAQPLTQLIGMKTGLVAEATLVPDAEALARQLRNGDIQLGVAQGIEYGWARQWCRDLQPLLLAGGESAELKACILVRRDDPAQQFVDLRSKRFVMPRRVLDHNHLFLNQCLVNSGGANFFSQSVEAENTVEAIEQVVDGAADATVVDTLRLEVYRSQKPGRFGKLRVLQESIAFPTAALIHHPGRSPAQHVAKFRDAMLNADRGAFGRQLLVLWKINRFQAVPAEYDELVSAAVRAFPEPRTVMKNSQRTLASP